MAVTALSIDHHSDCTEVWYGAVAALSADHDRDCIEC